MQTFRDCLYFTSQLIINSCLALLGHMRANLWQNNFFKLCILLEKRFVVCILLFAFSFSAVSAEPDIWIEIDTSKLQLVVIKNGKVSLRLNGISTGRFGASRMRMKGSNLTPIGTFKISSIRESQRFYKFFAIDYPNREIADLALRENRIDLATWKKIIHAIDNNKPVPQDTPLGGHLGVHGLGKGDLDIHRQYNWTNGCIALTNTQIDQLGRWLKPGMRVIIF
ncbi:MAG: L,D-transpeptidase [Nitrosomonas sp.]|nr:L,D-transpeptidase [Nitrosomonas sp.]